MTSHPIYIIVFLLACLVFVQTSDQIQMKVSSIAITRSYLDATHARNNLLHHVNNKLHPKVCAVCDRHIQYGEEKALSIDYLKHPVIKPYFHQDTIDWSEITEEVHIQRKLKNQYTQHCVQDRELNGLLLSPRSYKIQSRNVRKKCLGTCKECYNGVLRIKNIETTDPKPPKYAIANGKMHGYAPKVLLKLNEVELALISPARINKHMFCYTAGSHKSIQGWHSMFYSDIEKTNRVFNYLTSMDDDPPLDEDEETTASENEDIDIDAPSTVSSDDDNNDDEDSNDIEMETENEDENQPDTSDSGKSISVILVGPFTTTQKAMAKERTSVRPRFVKAAFHWLKENNILYRDYVLTDDEIIQPEIIDCTESAQSIDSNIEKVFEVTSIFPDPDLPTQQNGGCETAADLKHSTVENLFNGNSTLIGRPTCTLLKDYEGANFLFAFPLQFPFGTGSTDIDGVENKGVGYYKYLVQLSSPNFHRAEFVTIIHNLFEREKMVSGAYLRLTEEQKYKIGMLEGRELDEAIANFLSSKKGTGPADMFLSKIKAVTGCMGHTEQAAKQARQSMFCMIAHFGLPSCLFTITPDDDINFRIKIMSMNKTDYTNYKEPPSLDSSDEVLSEFVVDCSSIRTTYPGLCAIDFQNVIEITIRHFLGWDKQTQDNINNDGGLFGNLNGWCYAVEEQSMWYNTIYHFLLYL
jgi:hypothetical protein